MKQIPTDKYSIAWFTLAECVSRGEKERALGVYRLLSHSLDDQAYMYQLEGDLLLAFNDREALERYSEAARLYHKDKRILEAVAVYEHLFMLSPGNQQYITALIDLYKKLNIQSKVIFHLKTLFSLMLHQRDYTGSINALDELEELDKLHNVTSEHSALVFALLDEKKPPKEVVVVHIKKAIDGFIYGEDTKALHKFLTALAAKNTIYYNKACSYLEEENKELIFQE